MHTIYYIKYLQFLPTCFGPKDHHQGNVYNKHRENGKWKNVLIMKVILCKNNKNFVKDAKVTVKLSLQRPVQVLRAPES